MDWNQSVNNYCERTDASFFSEPLNLVSNAAFLIAAWRLYDQYKGKQVSKQGNALIIMIFIIGIGSSTFHSLATVWANFADVIPICIFLFSYLAFFLNTQGGLSPRKTLLGLIAFGIITGLAAFLADPIRSNGSQPYFGAWISLFGMACFSAGSSNKPSVRWLMPSAVTVLTVSIIFRTIDQKICPIWPLGTHFLWHILNAIVLYFVTKHFIESQRHEI